MNRADVARQRKTPRIESYRGSRASNILSEINWTSARAIFERIFIRPYEFLRPACKKKKKLSFNMCSGWEIASKQFQEVLRLSSNKFKLSLGKVSDSEAKPSSSALDETTRAALVKFEGRCQEESLISVCRERVLHVASLRVTLKVSRGVH